MILWALIGIVLIAVVWALIASSSGKAPTARKDIAYEPPPMVVNEPSKIEFHTTNSWEEGAKTSVSKNFGKGGTPTGIASDAGGMAAAKYDDDIEWMKKAQAFEPRITANLNLDVDEEEEVKKS